jgi:UDP-glucose 4-epimerase
MRTLRAAGAPAAGVDIKPSPFTDRCGSIADRGFVADCMQGIDTVYHAATLHKPHVATHGKQDFIDTNVAGTLNLLEAAARNDARAFVFTSTTSLYGDALVPPCRAPAVWVTERLRPVPRNIYGVTKAAAEDLCHLFHRNHGLNCLVLRTSRFFPEADDNPEVRNGFADANVKANEMLFRRVDVADIVAAHLLAAERAEALGFGRYIISATSPFRRGDLADLRADAPRVVARHFPAYKEIYESLGWRMFDGIGRVYVNAAARRDLGWRPQYDFARVLECLQRGADFRSPLARQIGSKGYHDEVFEEGPYPVEP